MPREHAESFFVLLDQSVDEILSLRSWASYGHGGTHPSFFTL